MRPSSFLVLVVIVVLGTLAVQAAVAGAAYRGQEADRGHVLLRDQSPFRGQQSVKGQGPVKIQGPQRGNSKPGSCPKVLIRCAMMNPPNACRRDTECQGPRKCCQGPCGMACLNPQ
ncbi:elafin [Rhynchonycteris naso]